MQELMAKGLTSDDINHGLRSVFGEDMRISMPAADEEDEEVTVDTRFGVLQGLAASLKKLDVMSFGRPGLQAELVPALASAGHPRHCFHVRRGFDIWFANPPDPRHHLLEGARRQADLSRGLPHETRKRRLVMWLQRRGHSWDTISGLLEQIELK